MHCAKCGTESKTGRKFCANCGNALAVRCPRCSAENEPSSKFCEDCGAALAPVLPNVRVGNPPRLSEIHLTAGADDGAGPLDGERKTVTALVADLKGSTALMEDLDPDEAHAVVDPVLRIMVEAVHRYEGYVVRTTGDGIFALFGAPVAHEDHPQRALSAALRLQQELHAHGQRRIAQGLRPLEARVGVHTGEVVAHSVETDGKVEYRLVGHTANLAARMEMVAPTGSIAASEYTRKLCEGYFTFKRLGPMVVKGVSEPVAVYEVTGFGPLRTRLQRAVARGLTKFVGREREIEALRHAAMLARDGRGQIVAAMADPGVGKSRLFYEFKATSASGWMVLEALSISHGRASAYLPVIDLLRNYSRLSSLTTSGSGERRSRARLRYSTAASKIRFRIC
jgi:adenylate cyclase